MKFKKGFAPWNKGKKMSVEQRKKLSDIRKKNPVKYWEGKKRPSGENHPRWKGGHENKLWHNNKRRKTKIGNGGSHTMGEWENLKAQYNWTCPSCKVSEPKVKLSRDHIIPLSKGGSDNIENIQPLCRSCNSKKHDKTTKF